MKKALLSGLLCPCVIIAGTGLCMAQVNMQHFC